MINFYHWINSDSLGFRLILTKLWIYYYTKGKVSSDHWLIIDSILTTSRRSWVFDFSLKMLRHFILTSHSISLATEPIRIEEEEMKFKHFEAIMKKFCHHYTTSNEFVVIFFGSWAMCLSCFFIIVNWGS